jgi:hypothetical protein
LEEPPSWCETDSLEVFTQRLQEQSRTSKELERTAQITSAIESPPQIEDDATLSLDLKRLADATGLVTDMAHALVQLHADLNEVEAQLREAASSETCPTCGQPYDADRLMGLAGNLGGHVHGAA